MFLGRAASQARNPSHIPVFEVTGGIDTPYLRTSTGDVYEGGRWSQVDSVELAYVRGDQLASQVDRDRFSWNFALAETNQTSDSSLLAWPRPGYGMFWGFDEIKISPHSEAGSLPSGSLPVSLGLDRIFVDGVYKPFSATFTYGNELTGYSWLTQRMEFSSDELVTARPSADPTYTQLPDGLPSRIRELAMEITSVHDSPYVKAKAIEAYLRTNYNYAYADAETTGPPPGWDPVDWFLFEQKEGTCGQFSSAFVVMARAVGVPARVASGWAVRPSAGSRTVYADQAHQWAEVAFNDLGWIAFEPTAANGAPSRAMESSVTPASRTEAGSQNPPQQSARVQPTIIDIAQWPSETRLGVPFDVGGWVTTASGYPVDTMEVELFINENKENGGLKVGIGTTDNGHFSVTVNLPAQFARGGYQLIAHALGNAIYGESWSDPEIEVYSGTELKLMGPATVSVDTTAIFAGQLSEESGAVITDQEILIAIDGQSLPPAYADQSGGFEFAHSFVEEGKHLVVARFANSDFLLGNEAQLSLEATLPSVLDITVPHPLRMGEEFALEGSLRNVRGQSLAGQTVTVSLADRAPHSIVTDGLGSFTTKNVMDSTGIHTLEAAFDGDGSIEPASYREALKVTEQVAITVDGERIARLGRPYSLTGKLTGSNDRPLSGKSVAIQLAGEGETILQTDAEGIFNWETTFGTAAETAVTVNFYGTPVLEPSRSLWPVEAAAPNIEVEAPEVIARGDVLTLRGTVAIGNWAGGDLEIVAVWNDERRVTGRTNGSGSFVLQYPVERDANIGLLELEITAASLDTAVKVAANVVSTASISAAPVPPAKAGELMQVKVQLLDDRDQGVPNAVLRYGPGESTVTGPDGATVVSLPIPDEAKLTLIPLTIEFDGDHSHLPVAYTAGLPVMPPAFDWLLCVGFPASLLLVSAGAYVYGYKRWTLIPGRGRGPVSGEGAARASATLVAIPDVEPFENVDEADRAVVSTDTPGSQTAAPDPRDLIATRLSLVFTNLPLSGDKIWRTGEPVDIVFVLTNDTGQPLADATLQLEWDGSPNATRLRTDPAGRCAAGLSNGDPGTYLVTARYPGDPNHLPVSVSEEFRLRGPEATNLEVVAPKPAEDLPDVWGIEETISIRIALTDASGVGVHDQPICVTIGDTAPPIVLITDAHGRCEFDWNAAVAGHYRVQAVFAGDPDYLPSSQDRLIELVEFRAEVVRRYNRFLAWARQSVTGIPDQATPREVEAMVVASGLPVNQRSLEEVIARFEEADYSLHQISRPRFESMYRACRELMGGPSGEED